MNDLQNGILIKKENVYYGIELGAKLIRQKPKMKWVKRLTQKELNKHFANTPKLKIDSPNLSKEVKDLFRMYRYDLGSSI